MTFTKLKTDKYRIDIEEILEKVVIVYKDKLRGGVQVKVSLNELPSALIKFLKQVDYLETHLYGVFKQNFNILGFGDIKYKEENKTLFSKFKKDIQDLFFNLVVEQKENINKFPAANEFLYILSANEEEEKQIRKKAFMPELEKLFIKLFDKLDLIYAVPFLSKKITIEKNEEIIFSLKIDFLADKFYIRSNIDSKGFLEKSIKEFNEKILFLENNINKIYSTASLESHFKLLSTSDFLPELGDQDKYSRNGFCVCIEKILIDFLSEKHVAFENNSDLELVSFSIDHEKAKEAQLSASKEYYGECPRRFIFGYGNFTSKNVIDIISLIRNKNFRHTVDMSSDFTRMLSVSKPH